MEYDRITEGSGDDPDPNLDSRSVLSAEVREWPREGRAVRLSSSSP